MEECINSGEISMESDKAFSNDIKGNMYNYLGEIMYVWFLYHISQNLSSTKKSKIDTT